MENKYRICFIVDHIATVGGVQRVVKVLSRALSDSCVVTIYCDDDPATFPNDMEKVKIKTFRGLNVSQSDRNLLSKVIDKCNKKTGILNNKKFNKILIKAVYPKRVIEYWIKELASYDVAIGVQGYYSFLLGVIGDRTKCKLIGWQHNSFEAYFRTPNMYSWNRDEMAKYAIQRLDSYVVLNESYKNDIKREFDLDVDVIYNPRSFDSEEKCQLLNKSFLAAGHLIPAKGFDRMIDSFAYFAERNKEWNLHIYGEGKDEALLRKRIEEYQISDRVFIHPYTNNISECFLASSVFLLPSRWEGMPMIVLEALELGVPTIAFDIQAVTPMITDGVEGYVVKDGDIKGFAEKMLQCTVDYADGRLRLMSLNALEKSKLFSISNITENWMKLFRRVTEES